MAKHGPRRIFLLTLMIAAACITNAAGQDSASQLRERLPSGSPKALAPKTTEKVTASTAQTAAEISVVLARPTKITFTHATVIADTELQAVAAPYLGRDLNREDLGSLAKDLTDHYRARGFVWARAVIPPQDASKGVLQVTVEEGIIAAIEVEGDEKHLAEDLEPYFWELLSGEPATRRAMQQALLTIGDLPGLRVIDSSVVPVADRPGVFRLIIKIEEDLVEGQVYVDNRDGSEQDRQVSGEVSVNGLFGTGTEIALAAYTSLDHPDRKKFAELSISAQLGLRGTMVEVTGSTAQSNNGVYGRPDRRESESYEVGLGLKHPFIRTSAASLWVNVELLQSNEWDKNDGRLDSKDELSILRTGLNTRLVLHEGAVTRASAMVSVGRDAFKHRPGSPLANPDDGAAFTKFAVSASHLQPLGGAFKVYAAMRGQYSEDNLPDGEQIYFGGARWGRAYDYSEIAGDTGLAGQIELRHLIKADALVKHVELYAFADSAATWTRGGEGEPDTLASAGLGVRAGFDDHVTANLEWAKPLTRIPDGQGDLDPRLFASVTFVF